MLSPPRPRPKVFGADSFPVARTRFNMGAVALKNNEYRRALELTESAMAVFRNNVGDKSTEVAIALRQRGNCLKGLGDMAGAMNDYKESLAIFDATGGPTVTGRLTTLLAIARLQCLERDRRGASATTARAKSALDPTNSDHAGWIKRFDDQLASCGS